MTNSELPQFSKTLTFQKISIKIHSEEKFDLDVKKVKVNLKGNNLRHSIDVLNT